MSALQQTVDGRVAVILGGGSGIGRATALALARRGCPVVIGDVQAERAHSVADEATALGSEAAGLACDVTQLEEIDAARDVALEGWGRIDIVMNTVGIPVAGLPLDIPLSAWQQSIDVNLLSVVRSMHTFLPTLLEGGAGHFVTTASTAGLYPYSYQRLPYSATKAAVVALSEALALYLHPQGVRVTCLCPATVATNIAETIEIFGEPAFVPSPGFEVLKAETVGEQVVAALEARTFLLLTHPEIHEMLIRRAQDPEGFVSAQAETVQKQITRLATTLPETGAG